MTKEMTKEKFWDFVSCCCLLLRGCMTSVIYHRGHTYLYVLLIKVLVN